jgi:hypothetical protein
MTEPGVSTEGGEKQAIRKDKPAKAEDDNVQGDNSPQGGGLTDPVEGEEAPLVRPVPERDEEQKEPGNEGQWNPETHGENPADKPETDV